MPERRLQKCREAYREPRVVVHDHEYGVPCSLACHVLYDEPIVPAKVELYNPSPFKPLEPDAETPWAV